MFRFDYNSRCDRRVYSTNERRRAIEYIARLLSVLGNLIRCKNSDGQLFNFVQLLSNVEVNLPEGSLRKDRVHMKLNFSVRSFQDFLDLSDDALQFDSQRRR